MRMDTDTDVGGHAIPEWTTGDRLRKARELTGLDQSDFAERIGVARNTVHAYEHGATRRPRRIVLMAWADATGVDYEWLRTGLSRGGRGGAARLRVA